MPVGHSWRQLTKVQFHGNPSRSKHSDLLAQKQAQKDPKRNAVDQTDSVANISGILVAWYAAALYKETSQGGLDGDDG